MKAIIWRGPGELAVERVPVPGIRPGESIIGVQFAGLCGSDRAIISGEYAAAQAPLILGHEVCGRVARETEGLPVGTWVTCDPVVTCGRCRNCLRGLSEYCESSYEEIGITRPGAWAEFMSVPIRNLHPLPPSLSGSAGALIEPLTCALKAIQRGRVEPGERVLIIGDGQLGMLAVAAAHAAGAVVDLLGPLVEQRGATALALGAYDMFGSDAVLDVETKAATYDVVIDAVGLQETFNTALGCARRSGRIVLLGMHTAKIDGLLLREVVMGGIQILGSNSGRDMWSTAISLLESGIIRLDPLLDGIIEMTEVPDWAAGREGYRSRIKYIVRIVGE